MIFRIKGYGEQGGFTLVEIMVAVAIGLFLAAGMIQVFVANKQTYRFNEALARMQESGRYALDRIGRGIRMADFWGCAGTDKITDNLNNDSDGNPIFGTPPAGVDGTDGVGANGSDEIRLSGVADLGLAVASTMAGASGDLVVTGPSGNIGVDDILMVTNCQSGDVFQVTDVNSSGGGTSLSHASGSPPSDATDPPNNSRDAFSEVYDDTASLYRAQIVKYYVKDRFGQPTLYRHVIGGRNDPLTEGVAQMQITYGRDLDLTDNVRIPNRYEPAPAAPPAGWFDGVVSVRVSLLLQSIEENLADADAPQQINFNGGIVPCPADRRICQVMTATFTMRNRAP